MYRYDKVVQYDYSSAKPTRKSTATEIKPSNKPQTMEPENHKSETENKREQKAREYRRWKEELSKVEKGLLDLHRELSSVELKLQQKYEQLEKKINR
jgi:hypothetical protein